MPFGNFFTKRLFPVTTLSLAESEKA